MRWETYKVARSLEEAFDCLEQFQGKVRVIAGGTDLVVQLLEKDPGNGMVLLDISSIADMRGVELVDGGKKIVVGAATTMAELAESEIIVKYGRALALGASHMGAPQIRNVATIGGNVVNAQPAADGTIPLLALGAEARVVSAKAEKWVAMEELFLDVGRSSVNPSEQIITHFRFKPTAETGSTSLQRLARRKAFTLPTLLVAVSIQLDKGKQFFEEVRIAVGPVARTPWLAREAMDSLQGSRVSHEAVEKAGAGAKLAAHPRDSLRGGAEYRKEMVEVLTKRAILECLNLLGVNL